MCTLSALSHIRDEQRRDPILSELIQKLDSAAPDPSLRLFVLKDDTLYRYNVHPDGRELLLVVPTHLRLSVLGQLHDAPTAGHLGVSRTYDRVRRRFFWPGLYRSVRRYVAACEPCQRRKKPPKPPAGLLQHLDVPEI